LARSSRYRRFCSIVKFCGLSVHGQSRGPSSLRRSSRPSAAFLHVHGPSPHSISNSSNKELKCARLGPPRSRGGDGSGSGEGAACQLPARQKTQPCPGRVLGMVVASQALVLGPLDLQYPKTDWPIRALLIAERPDFCERCCSWAASACGSGSAAIRASIRRPGRIRGDSRCFLASNFQDGSDQLGDA
jgi:hypothetical protein